MRHVAVLLLALSAGADEVDALIADLTKDRDPLVRIRAAQSLAEQGDEADRAVPVLLKQAKADPDRRVQLVCLQTLGQLRLRPKEVIPAVDAEMRKQLKRPDGPGQDRNYGVINGGLELLRLYGNDAHESLAVAIHCLKDPYPMTRARAARAASSVAMTDKEIEQAVKALKAVADADAEKAVRDAARAALKTLQP